MHNKSKMSQDINFFSLLYVHDPHVRLHLDGVWGGVGAGWRAVKRVERNNILGPGVPQLPQLRLLTCHLRPLYCRPSSEEDSSTFPDSGGEEEEPFVDGGQVLDAVCRQTNDDAFLPFQCFFVRRWVGGGGTGTHSCSRCQFPHAAFFVPATLRGQSRFCTKFRFFDFPFPLRI